MATFSPPRLGSFAETFCVLGTSRSAQGVVGLSLCLSLLSCSSKPPAHATTRSGSGEELAASAAVLKPGASPGATATLRLGSSLTTEFEVTLRQHTAGPEVVLELMSGGETLEREVYDAQAQAFRLVAAADDGFAPPIEIVRYPAHDGDVWDWKGKVVYAGSTHDANATITLSKDGEAIRSVVDLKVSADEGRPDLERSMKFWFEPGKGVVRRAFGDVSSRRPSGEPWRP